MAFVYWIRLPEHSDITSQGYVGITSKSVSKRFNAHRRAAEKTKFTYPIYRAIKKYGEELLLETILEGSLDYCALIEEKLRPIRFIGWNIAIGGSASQAGAIRSSETRIKLSKSHKGKSLSPETISKRTAKQSGLKRSDHTRSLLSKAAQGRKAWATSRSKSDVWLKAQEIREEFLREPCGAILLAKRVGLSGFRLSAILSLVKSGWNPEEDTEYQVWLSNNKIKEPHGT